MTIIKKQKDKERSCKTCSNCNVEKNISEFYFSNSKDCYYAKCKECKRLEHKRNPNRLEIDINNGCKICTKCKEEKELDQFYFAKNYYRSWCKKCCLMPRKRFGYEKRICHKCNLLKDKN